MIAQENNAGRPLNVLFLITSLEVGGAETLLVNMMRQFDPCRIVPQVACLKQAGALGEQVASEFEIHSQLIAGKYDARVLGRLKRLMKEQKVDAVVTVGAGDKMFWGRLAARQARIPVTLSALHSTGWPDGVGRLNRLLTPITDGFIAVAEAHREYLIAQENFPKSKVFLIPNGVDTDRFVFDSEQRIHWREKHGIPLDSPVCGIVAALREEKNHELFLQLCESVTREIPNAHYLIIGDGERRSVIESIRDGLACRDRVHVLGNSYDIPAALSAMDLFALTSRNEASPVSILEAMAVGIPVVAPNVGSISQAVDDGVTGFLVTAGDCSDSHRRWCQLLSDPALRAKFGAAGRRRVLDYGSLQAMTEGYTRLIEGVWARNTGFTSGVFPPTFPVSDATGPAYASGRTSHSG